MSATLQKITDTRRPQDLFGEDITLAGARKIYRVLVQETHPDLLPPEATEEELAEAVAAFVRLTELWDITRELFAQGRWKEPGLAGLTVVSKKRRHVIGALLERGMIADVYACGSGTIKIARLPKDADLMRREVSALKKIRRATEAADLVYLPKLVDALRVKDAKRIERQANVFDPLLVNVPEHSGQWVTLADVISAFPHGINPRDAAWMWRRLLVAIGIAHDAGVVHHAPFPDRVMILPPEHGLVLTDWCFSADLETPPVAIDPRYRDWYPEEVDAKEPSRPETDIAIAGRTMIALLGGDPITGVLPETVPRMIRAHLRACTLRYGFRRSGDARRLLASFDDLIERLWGPRRFREFHMPTTNRRRP